MSLPVIYKKAPIFLQEALINIQGYRIQKRRFGKDFQKQLEFYEKSNPDEVDVLQMRKFLQNANKSPFWKSRFEKYKVNIESNHPLEEISKLPILKKIEVVDNAQSIKIEQKNISKVNTSGTTGAGLVFQQTQEMENKQWAIWWRYRKRFGIKLDEKMAWFGGRTIIPFAQKKPPYWRHNHPMKQIMFSAYHLNIDTVHLYYNKLRDSKVKWLHGYPSQLSYLAQLIQDKGLKPLSNIKYITVGAENLLEHQKTNMKNAFGVEPIQHYGLAEGVANISQLPNGNLQIDQDFAYLEMVPSDFAKNTFHIIGTNYNNLAFPLIRYDTNDLLTAEYKDENLLITSIDGRNEDFITLPNGVKLGRLDHIFKTANYIKEAQIYQPDINNIVLRIVKGKNYDNKVHNSSIIHEAEDKFGKDINISLEFMDEIPKTSSGKLKFVISDLK